MREECRMAMGKKRATKQRALWVNTSDLPASPGHPFYERLNEVLGSHGFDAFVEERCQKFYHATIGRPSMPPGV